MGRATHRGLRRRAICLVAVGGLAVTTPGASATSASQLRVDTAALTQRGDELGLRIVTSAPARTWLDTARTALCVSLSQADHRLRTCLTGKRGVSVDVLGPEGQQQPIGPLPGLGSAGRGNTVVIRLPLERVGLVSGRVDWSVTAQLAGPGCSRPGSCSSRWPTGGSLHTTIVAPAAAGCAARGRDLRYSGSVSSRGVALTFDDGPGPWTLPILKILEQQRATATFFVVGSQIGGYASLLERMLADGDAIGNHSYSHPVLSGDGLFAHWEIERTQSLVEAAAGYRPCLFRAPYGDTSPALVRDAAGQGLLTIGWNDDPRDWSRPGVARIVQTTTQELRPGSIIELHDGGGDRAQTVAALPRIIEAARSRGLRTLTVPQLLGLPGRGRNDQQRPAAVVRERS